MGSLAERLFFLSERDAFGIRQLTRYLEERHPDWLARFDHLVPGRNWYPNGGPMNGQSARCQLVRELAVAKRFEAVVETGAFLGATTEFLRFVFGAPVWTVEVRPRNWAFSAFRLHGLEGVYVHRGDSRALLRELASQRHITSRSTFFYLDAHWYRDLPLWEEVNLILEYWRDPLVLVDDFKVPHDQGYGWDDYGPGARLCLEDLWSHVPHACEISFPGIPSEMETGARRGYCLVAKHDTLAEFSRLALTEPVQLPTRS